MCVPRSQELEERRVCWYGTRCFRCAFAYRHDAESVQRLDRALRAWIESANRLDHVTNELDADGQLFSGGEDVEDAATPGELAVRIYRIGRFIAAEHQCIGELMGINIDARLDFARRQQDRGRLWQAGQ